MNVTCLRCRCSPCSCDWIAKLETTPSLAEARDVAVVMFSVPLPKRAGETTYHFNACPCPKCWSLRAASWVRDGPYPTPPERESWPQLHQPDQEDAS